MEKQHHYTTTVVWTGNRGNGTSGYTAYDRDHVITATDKPEIPGSSDPAFRGKKDRYNPEETLVAALSACHMLWYLHVCAVNGVIVEKYTDSATGTMDENKDGSGQFSKVTLRPVVTVKSADMMEKAAHLHNDAHKMCFIARSVNFSVQHEPTIHSL